ncbi:unnamed protein product [Ranitomeya imitator]|uniref:Mandelate racemase/muconate lactonizing enzyme C-terminal domain-containing protein n=1 Tax=Ranitomeya imitator TaxID=111125 RepID=A0ABN9LL23_9NEOB|nr:unnamed protein product [Ranitomeya imitator]
MSKSTIGYLKRCKLKVLQWPSQSSDLNIIGNLWLDLKIAVHKFFKMDNKHKKQELCAEALKEGWTRFKVKVGADLHDDVRRCRLIRDMIGPANKLMLDANQRWDVIEAISWVKELAAFKPLWIEEPTSPDDILGHATISQALAPLGIGVATGEQEHTVPLLPSFLVAAGVLS